MNESQAVVAKFKRWLDIRLTLSKSQLQLRVLMVQLPSCVGLICTIVSLKPKNHANNLPQLSNPLLKFNSFLMVSAWDVTKFHAMLTFCITLIGNKLFKIIFLFETTFIFPQHYLSREVCMIYPDSYWLSAYLLPFVGMSTLLWLWCLELLIYGN